MVPLEELEGASTRQRGLRLFLAVLPALAFLGLLWYGLSKTGGQAEVGDKAPEFELPSVTGEGTLSNEDLEGSPVVINFWASYCIPCRIEAEVLEETWREYEDEGVIFLGVNIKDRLSHARRFIEDFNITYPNVRDVDQELVRALGVFGLPETFFIDHNYTFVGTFSGPRLEIQQDTVILGAIDKEDLVTNIDVLLRRMSDD